MASLLVGVGAPPNPMAATLSFSKSHSPSPSPSPSFSFLPPSALTLSTPAPLPSIYCGRGDKKTARGKRFNHSFGNARPKDKKKGRGPPRVPAPPLPPRKDKYDDGEVIKIEIDDSFSN